jgi:hypothetical protein
MSRRGAILGIGAVTGVAAMSAGVRSAFAQSPAPSSAEPCVRLASRARFAETRRHSSGGLKAQQETSFDRATGAVYAILTIDRGGKLVARLEMQRTRDGATKTTTTYGAEIQGPRSIVHASSDGRSFVRSVDGRPSGTGAPQPQDTLKVDPALRQELRSLFAGMKLAPQTCRREDPPLIRGAIQAPPSRPLAHPPAPARSGVRSLTASASPPGTFRRAAFNWFEPNSHEAPACTQCGTDCNNDYGKCIFDSDNLIDLLLSAASDIGPQVAIKVAVCLGDYAACGVKCQLPGNGCCPVQCGSITDECCGQNSTCMLPSGKTCCPPGQRVCRGTCCEQGVAGCAADGFCGCPQGQTPCGDACCSGAGVICCGNTGCCTADKCHNGLCTDIPVQLAKCGGVQCGPFDNCCGGKCCTGTCTANNQCCPPGSGCGSNCCAPGQVCTDSNKGICSAPTGCPAGQSSCETHMPGAAQGVNTQICCPSSVTCCLGRCCPPDTECCAGGCQSTCVR